MKNIIVCLLVGMVLGGLATLASIRIDGVNEVDNGVITIEVFGQYLDYEYEYNSRIEK